MEGVCVYSTGDKLLICYSQDVSDSIKPGILVKYYIPVIIHWIAGTGLQLIQGTGSVQLGKVFVAFWR